MIYIFSGNLYWVKKFNDLGCYFSFSVIVIYKNNLFLLEVL